MATEVPDMEPYIKALEEHTPQSSRDTPLSELVIFKCRPEHTPPSEAALTRIENDFAKNSAKGDGIRYFSWGVSLNDSSTVVAGMDWRKIQDHWQFWRTPAFVPVITALQTFFVNERPLVRHYKFGEQGMLRHEWQRWVVFDNGEADKSEEEMKEQLGIKSEGQAWKEFRGGFAGDMGETTWYCGTLGYDSEEALKKDDDVLVKKGVVHLVKIHQVEG